MRKVQASEAKTHLPKLLDDVERGETLVITRHGRAIARIVPEEGRRQREVEAGLEEIAEVRRKTRPVTVKELLSARDRGRRA
jgi:prevent-host-death family protein